MGLAVAFGLVLIALAIIAIMLWGAFEALVRFGRFIWRLMVEAQ